LWKYRNLKIWENITENSTEVVDRARHLQDDWHEANLPRTNVSLQADTQQMHSVVYIAVYTAATNLNQTCAAAGTTATFSNQTCAAVPTAATVPT